MDFDKILLDKEYPAYLKELVRNLRGKGHISVGNWLKTTSTVDLLSAINSCKEIKKSPPTEPEVGSLPSSVAGSFVLLLEILCTGEGLEISNSVSVFITRAKYLEGYIVAELLVRRGFDIQIDYNNLTLTEEIIPDLEKNRVLIVGEKYNDQMKNVINKITTKFSEFDKELKQIIQEFLEKSEEINKEFLEKPEEINKEFLEKPEEINKESLEKSEEINKEFLEKPEEINKESLEKPEGVVNKFKT